MGGRGASGKSKGGGGGRTEITYESLKKYKGHTIAKVTAKDYVILNKAGEKIAPSKDSKKPSFRLQREAKAFIDGLK